MTDPDMSRSDWQNEAHQSMDPLFTDNDIMQQAAVLLAGVLKCGAATYLCSLADAAGTLYLWSRQVNDDDAMRDLVKAGDVLVDIAERAKDRFQKGKSSTLAADIADEVGMLLVNEFDIEQLKARGADMARHPDPEYWR